MVRGVAACVGGMGLFFWGRSGGHGPIVMGPGFVMGMGLILALYGVTTLTAATWTRRRLKLTPEEWGRWGHHLQSCRDDLLSRMAQGESVGTLADEQERNLGVPRLVTLRYIIQIGREASR